MRLYDNHNERENVNQKQTRRYDINRPRSRRGHSHS